MATKSKKPVKETLELSYRTPRKGKAKGINVDEEANPLGDNPETIPNELPRLPEGPTFRGRITPFVFQVYPPFRIAVKNVEIDTLIEGEVYDMILSPILFDPEADSVRKICIYANDARTHLNRGFYRTASTKADLFAGLQILEPTMAGPNGSGVVGNPNANLNKWLMGLKEMWDKRQEIYENALKQSQL